MPGIDECLSAAMAIAGARAASLIDWSSGLALGSAGVSPTGDHETTAAEATDLVRTAFESETFTVAEDSRAPLQDIILTAGRSYHLICFIDTVFDSPLVLHLWLDRTEGNLASARYRLQALAEELVLG
ncbi:MULTISPECIES: hypothetical protein [Streptomycetaceae]|uniref:hypothetical protein n=1 Tax=Streptomycetaceae TaxID=2062 RepID=UPI000CDBBC15|nr:MULTISPECIES: hypothetical protein [Streptomycetaceae]AUY48560.1 hypothetical protein C2142_05855 [Streptomyces sp. CB01881]MBP0450876.1 hypothetical protein [Kitasatospora sp. RG8]TYC77051.1 hypothetical protein EH183_05865 [Streptomyces sp. CB01881]